MTLIFYKILRYKFIHFKILNFTFYLTIKRLSPACAQTTPISPLFCTSCKSRNGCLFGTSHACAYNPSGLICYIR